MTTEAFVGNVFLERERSGSPGEYTRVCQVFDITGVGEDNALVDATTFCSGGYREYIGGLADGMEPVFSLNFETGATEIFDWIADCKAKLTTGFRLVVEDGSPTTMFTFDALCKTWEFAPKVDDRNTINFTVKISGAITITP